MFRYDCIRFNLDKHLTKLADPTDRMYVPRLTYCYYTQPIYPTIRVHLRSFVFIGVLPRFSPRRCLFFTQTDATDRTDITN